MRYSLQQINDGGYISYEIIDTENKCEVLYTSKNFSQIYNFIQWLENNKDMPIYYNGREI